MLTTIAKNSLTKMQHKYQYDTAYLQHILHTDGKAFVKLMMLQPMYEHNSGIPANVYFAAKLTAVTYADCGACIELTGKMAMEHGMTDSEIQRVLRKQLSKLPEDIALAVQFTEHVLESNPNADQLRTNLKQRWGEKGLIGLSYCIASAQIYPRIKQTLGYTTNCQQIVINDKPINTQQ
jgi:hypothetical protein